MKKIFFTIIGTLLLYSCDNDTVSRTGYLDVDVRYTGGAREWELDGVKIAFRRIETDNLEQKSEWISETGKQKIELPMGKYELELTGNRCKTDDLNPPNNIVKINPGETTPKAISIEHLPYSVVVKYKDKEMSDGDTITFSSIAALDLWNKYSTNELHWEAKIAHTLNWITFTKGIGRILGGKTDYALFEIEELPNYGHNYAEVIITTEDAGTFTIIVDIFKQGGEPEKATITGSNENACPETNVILTAEATGAISYKWYKGNVLIEGEHTDKYNATESGIYSVTSINTNGEGIKSDGKLVTINSCAIPPAKATISGENENVCPATSITITVNATGATSYKWYKGSSIISGENGNSYTVTQSGTYYAVGVNTNGEGIKSDGKAVTISTCVAVPATATISGNSSNNCSGTNGLTVILTANATRATSYIWRKGNEQLNETVNTLEVNETGTYYVKGVNESGAGQESVAKQVAITSCIPSNPANIEIDTYETQNKIYINWDNVTSATSYKIQVCNNSALTGCENNYYNITNSSRYFTHDELFCGQNYFRIIAVNDFGESTGSSANFMMTPAITAYDGLSVTYNYATQQYQLSYIDADVSWYSGTISFEIQRKAGTNVWEAIDTITGNTNESMTTWHNYSDSYSSNETVYYRVRSYINTSCGIYEDYSNVDYFTR
jgi:hypothetical protein